MQQVYEQNLWGSNGGDFYSGEGSHHPEMVNPYIIAVKTFLNAFEHPLMVCDLGCGDFNVGKQLVPHTKKYVAIDIVPDLIKRNSALFKDDKLAFHCLDIALDKLPTGDCAILRQVLQHLSNDEIHHILPKLASFKYLILTEHLPEGDFEPNRAIISGQGIRLKKQSGVDILASPFHFKVKEAKELLSIKSPNFKGVIVTTLYTNL